jgi:RND superfamily putative drug exporter
MLTWNTPFFAFIMLVALGVDYSIFLVVKFREGMHDPPSIDAKVLRATSIIGTVVISAGVILSGTFAALIPSGVTTLIQVALVVITGIFLLVLLIPVVMPAVMKITYPTPNSKINDQSHEEQ